MRDNYFKIYQQTSKYHTCCNSDAPAKQAEMKQQKQLYLCKNYKTDLKKTEECLNKNLLNTLTIPIFKVLLLTVNQLIT